MGGIREEKEVSLLDDQLDEFGFQSKPGSTKGRMYSSRFYHKELKMVIKNLMLELIGEDSKFRAPEDELDRGIQIGYDTLRAELREKVEDL